MCQTRLICHLYDKFSLHPSHQLVHLVDDQLGHMVVGGQLDLELDRGGIVLRFAQVVLAPSAPLASFDHEVLVFATP